MAGVGLGEVEGLEDLGDRLIGVAGEDDYRPLIGRCGEVRTEEMIGGKRLPQGVVSQWSGGWGDGDDRLAGGQVRAKTGDDRLRVRADAGLW